MYVIMLLVSDDFWILLILDVDNAQDESEIIARTIKKHRMNRPICP